jgi:hypothetical protein
MILYIHGFLSSPQSFKARLIAARLTELGMPDGFACPILARRTLPIVSRSETGSRA